MTDRNFDPIAQRFTRTIYQHPKGRLRLAALQQDFRDLLPDCQNQQVLDLGGGQGQFSLWLAQQGAQIYLNDLSSEMLALAEQSFSEQSLPLSCLHAPLQEVDQYWPQSFDLVMNHAVLEWLAEPMLALELIANKVAEGGHLSLMFYNLHGHVWRQIMNGRTEHSETSNPRLRQEGNAPQNPLAPNDVFSWLENRGFRILRWRGIRCIYDHMHEKIRQRLGEMAYSDADLSFGLQDPYRQLGRYVHVFAQKHKK